jgi:hypothetical protein
MVTKVTKPRSRRTPRARSASAMQEPEKLDLKKGRQVAEQMIRENVEWLKEMAKR